MQAPRDGLLLWESKNPTQSYMWEFLELVNSKYNKSLKSYDDLYNWSVECIPQFWEEVWAFTGVEAESHVDALNGNGSVNGGTNGHANGHVNGYANGHANGHANGNSNGFPKRPFKHVSHIFLLHCCVEAVLGLGLYSRYQIK
jgi:hypothetical protein